jgi:hypothetical protein
MEVAHRSADHVLGHSAKPANVVSVPQNFHMLLISVVP